MEYLDKENAKKIRTALKKAFPDYKLSVTVDGGDVLRVVLLAADIPFDKDYKQVNHYHLESLEPGKMKDFWLKVDGIRGSILPVVNSNADDPYADYSDLNYYVEYAIGRWDHPYEYSGK